MSPARRAILCTALLTVGLGAQAALERLVETPRPPLRRPLAELPRELGGWIGQDLPIAPEIREKSQGDDLLSRAYEDPRRPGRRVQLWMNYSRTGLNMRHSPEVCLPGHGYEKVESRCRVLTVAAPGGRSLPITRLCYAQGELVQGIGFWYYIFGEGRLERFVRGLPITSRSSHGRTTRGSGLTVEVFCPGDSDPEGETLAEFARELLAALEPILPEDRAEYYVP